MFTGIVTAIGTISEIEQLDEGRRFTILAPFESDGIDIGASIAHDGLCLTVVEKTPVEINVSGPMCQYKVEAWTEALGLTTAGSWSVGRQVNLERSLKIGDELGGHLVSGHIDGLAKITAMQKQGQATQFTLRAPKPLAKFIAPKGSVCLDGTSLTVNQVADCCFDILVIKHTAQVTGWHDANVGDSVNLEVDQMARYAARLAQFDRE